MKEKESEENVILERKIDSKKEGFWRRNRLKLIILLIVLILIGALDLMNHSALSANFADSVLRPLLGNQNTITLESLFFNGSDKLNQLTDKLISPTDPFSGNSNPSLPIRVATSPRMLLNPIQLNNNFPMLAGEGEWQPINMSLFPTDTVIAKTFIRPDPERPYAIVSMAKIDVNKLRLSAVAGTWEPGGAAHKGPGKIPQDVQSSNQLVAAFNGGFQEKDGHYGMIVGNETYLPLKTGLATLVIDKNSNLSIIKYQGQDLGKDNLVIRQNGIMLIDNSVIVPLLKDNQYNIWGRTVTNSMYTWRSGIGITNRGNLVYAVGPYLVPATLAKALLDAGAVNAMQLDINPFWVRFVVFNPMGQGKYQHYSLLKSLYDGGDQFLRGYNKDFFYLYKR